jgi:hypothetical protein
MAAMYDHRQAISKQRRAAATLVYVGHAHTSTRACVEALPETSHSRVKARRPIRPDALHADPRHPLIVVDAPSLTGGRAGGQVSSCFHKSS